MIEKVILNPNEDLPSTILEWDEEKEDFVMNIPNGITRCDLIDLVEEIKRITMWDD